MSASVDPSLRAYYAARAPYYDAVYDKPERIADIALLRNFLPARFAGRRVIEVACGTGYWSQFIAPAAYSLVATDLIAEPLEFAKQRPSSVDAQFVQADAYDLPTLLGKFNAAFAGLWLSHVPIGQRSKFFSSLHSLLEPGSPVVLIDNSEVQCQEYPIAESDSEGNTYQSRPLRDASVHQVLKNFPTEQ
jgi:ubiquinone/menaquinone biosynthesis C-methylase UbiE